MLLTVNVGNTNISFGLFKGSKLVRKFAIPTKKYRTAKLKNLISGVSINDCIVCSVVPFISRKLKKDLKSIIGKKPFLVGSNIKVPLKNLYRLPNHLGQDRLVNAYAASILYGAPVIVVDLGTTITCDVVSKNKEFLGGMIMPGLEISLDALAKRTALLPRISLSMPKDLIGTDTKDCIKSGLVFGLAALIKEVFRKLKIKVGLKAKLVGTGGDVDFIDKLVNFDKKNINLTLEGLRIIYYNMLL